MPATKAVPKELFPIGDQPAIQVVIDEALGAVADVGPGMDTAAYALAIETLARADFDMDDVTGFAKLVMQQDAEASEMIQRGQRLKTEVEAEIEEAEAELAAVVAAPVGSGVDPTSWIPDELMIMILLHVVFLDSCGSVCRRWKRLYSDRVLRESVWASRWEAYAREGRQPVTLEGHQHVRFWALL